MKAGVMLPRLAYLATNGKFNMTTGARALGRGEWRRVVVPGAAAGGSLVAAGGGGINEGVPGTKRIVSGTPEKRQLPTLTPGGALPSAPAGLTSLFGMGRGGSPPP